MTATFTAIFEQDGDWWVGYVEELPGANTQGATLDEARENLKEAVELIIEANRELAQYSADISTAVASHFGQMLLAELLDGHSIHHFIVETTVGIDRAAQAALKLETQAFVETH